MENKNNDKKVINCKFSQIFLEFVALLLVWNDSNSVFLRQLKRNNLKQIRNMKKIRAAVVGYGNIGKFTLEALEAAPDFEVAGIVRRNGAENKPAELADYPVVKDIRELKDVDVAILATPTRSVEQYAKEILALGINTVDSFDIHTQITSLRRSLGETAKAHNAVAIISAGWDPGSDSVVDGGRLDKP